MKNTIWVVSFCLGLGTAMAISAVNRPGIDRQEPSDTIVQIPAANKPLPESLAPNATAVCLLTLERIKEDDQRPACGSLYDVLQFSINDGVGDVAEFSMVDCESPLSFKFVTDFGGLRMVDDESFDLPYSEFNSEMLTIGKQYYLVFGQHEKEDELPPGLIAWWPAESTAVPENIRAAIPALPESK